MDYVYICRQGENEELRYSLRSLVKNAPDGRVWIVGNKPSWYAGDFLAVKDVAGKFENIRTALLAIANHDEISEDFILMNDDFFIINKINNIPTIHGGLLADKIEEYEKMNGSPQYLQILSDAHKYLINHGIKNPLDYDIHVPMIMNRKNLKRIAKKTLAPRSVYGNMYSIGGDRCEDVKVYPNSSNLVDRSYDFKNNPSDFLSSDDKSFPRIHRVILRNSFAEKSQYER